MSLFCVVLEAGSDRLSWVCSFDSGRLLDQGGWPDAGSVCSDEAGLFSSRLVLRWLSLDALRPRVAFRLVSLPSPPPPPFPTSPPSPFHPSPLLILRHARDHQLVCRSGTYSPLLWSDEFSTELGLVDKRLTARSSLPLPFPPLLLSRSESRAMDVS